MQVYIEYLRQRTDAHHKNLGGGLINMTTMMAFQEDDPGALLKSANISIEQTKSRKVFMINFAFSLKL